MFREGQIDFKGVVKAASDRFDPANRLLNHFSAEGPEPYLVYRGNATLDDRGQATITLPSYFQSINAEPTYQLTPIGAPANLYVLEEIRNNQFKVAGGNPGMKVSWTVTAIRNDPIVQRHGFQTEPLKPATHRGRLLRPDVYNLPTDRAVRFRPAASEAPQADPATLEPVGSPVGP